MLHSSWESPNWRGFLRSAPDNMFAVGRGSPEQAAEANARVSAFMSERVPLHNPKRRAGIAYKDAKSLHQRMLHNPMLRDRQRLDPKGDIGLCFGMAFETHAQAARAGVEQDKLRKLWAVGRLVHADGRWGDYHVPLAVQAVDREGWYVIDREYKKPLLADEWIPRFTADWSHGEDKAVRIYVTPATRFGPASPAHYDRQQMLHPVYNGAFSESFARLKASGPRAQTRFQLSHQGPA